ncbi:protein translocase subunit SecD [Nocardioides speluncae]|uniref:protein translocase subunit SecD n=1 Tax=Nocardioides speluncae TaxID=2670337 RepID=UPI000D689149|nr:protein translocase subunit SecD [Nocardioides speluncae]
MAKNSAQQPVRTLVVFFLAMAVLFGLVALAGAWKPKLGLDLQGGTRITLTAKGDVESASLEEAAGIIDQRVNGSGVAEAEVTTQGSKYINVEIPGKSRRDLVATVERQAQLRFRLVGASSLSGSTGDPTQQIPGSGVLSPEQEQPPANEQPEQEPSGTATPKSRPPVGFATDPTETPSSSGTPSGSTTSSPSAPTDSEAPADEPETTGIDAALGWQNAPDDESMQAYNAYQCPAEGEVAEVVDDPKKPLVACDDRGTKYLMSAAVIEGTDLDDSTADYDQQQLQWSVGLKFNGDGSKVFSKISQTLFGTQKLFAIVLDGQVLSAPTMNDPNLSDRASISGSFNESSANSLATSLKYGALPVAFEKNPNVETVGPSLAGNQLTAGITGAVIGLGLVMLYCLFYYRGLGLVVIASLLLAGVATYGFVLLLGEAAGFTLSLPGIAGLIIAVGIVADAFVVFFERIRDEMREGKSMRVAVESGWVRARSTRIAANTVSLLSATVLYIFSVGVVKGFAFALGLSTLIDLAVFFWFTKPMVSYLATYKFFSSGHKWSGLDQEALGVSGAPAPVAATVGGKA